MLPRYRIFDKSQDIDFPYLKIEARHKKCSVDGDCACGGDIYTGIKMFLL